MVQEIRCLRSHQRGQGSGPALQRDLVEGNKRRSGAAAATEPRGLRENGIKKVPENLRHVCIIFSDASDVRVQSVHDRICLRENKRDVLFQTGDDSVHNMRGHDRVHATSDTGNRYIPDTLIR